MPTKTTKPESSQEDIKDYSPQNLSQTNPALFMERYNKNEISLAGKVIDLTTSDPKPKYEKDGSTQVINEDGSMAFWEPFYSAEIIFEGGSMRMNLQSSIYQGLVVGKRYLFEGMMGLEFKKINPKFYNATLIM